MRLSCHPSPLAIRIVIVIVIAVITILLTIGGHTTSDAVATVTLVTTTALGLARQLAGSKSDLR